MGKDRSLKMRPVLIRYRYPSGTGTEQPRSIFGYSPTFLRMLSAILTKNSYGIIPASRAAETTELFVFLRDEITVIRSQI